MHTFRELTEALRCYEEEVPLTGKQRRDLHLWVANGNDPEDFGSELFDALIGAYWEEYKQWEEFPMPETDMDDVF